MNRNAYTTADEVRYITKPRPNMAAFLRQYLAVSAKRQRWGLTDGPMVMHLAREELRKIEGEA